MDEEKKGALQRCRVTFASCLDVFKLTDDLYSKYVISDFEYRSLLDEKVEKSKFPVRLHFHCLIFF